jgi:hypothetical protein
VSGVLLSAQALRASGLTEADLVGETAAAPARTN